MMTEAFRDPSLPVEERVADLLSRMTVEEKAGQLTQYFHFGSMFAAPPEGVDVDAAPDPMFAHIRTPDIVEGEVAAGRVGSVLFVRDAVNANRIQRRAVEETRLGIPLIFGFDVIHGMRTIFPVPIGLAASWDLETIAASQAVAAREARAHGIHWTFAPMVDIARDPRWGRMIEGAGEDPYLGGQVAAAQVRGFQGDLGPESVIAGPKHFAGYGAAIGGRDYEETEISDSQLYNVYLPPFKAAIDAGAGNVMSAYQELNGVPATGNRWLLTDVLRGEWGFEGWVVSDANAVYSLEAQHFAADQPDAGTRALNAGLDMEMTMFEPAYSFLPDAVADGRVDVAVLDASVSRILAAKFRLGLFENPYTDEELAGEVLGAPEHGETARRAAEHSFVLLKNDGVLPLDRTRVSKLAVIGQLAASKRDTLGPWVFDHTTADAVTILDALNVAVGPDVEVSYASGASVPERFHPHPFDTFEAAIAATPADYDDDAAIAEAVALAGASDVAVVVIGERQNQAGELASRSTLAVEGRQLEQLEAIVATGTKVVLLVMSTRPLDLRWASENVNAILDVWYPGTRGGDAVASVLLGEISPAGRLPFTWPRHVGQVPMYYAHQRTFQSENAGRRYWDEPSTPLYPFGFGLSYGNFEYANLRLSSDAIARGESVTVSVDVTNTSRVEADEVVQLYIHQRHGSAARPVRELKGFRRVEFAPGETQTVSFELTPAEFTYWSAATRGYVQDATTFDVWVGADSTASLGVELKVS
jgi:beta-glucosidase